jgi:hypothetical protein
MVGSTPIRFRHTVYAGMSHSLWYLREHDRLCLPQLHGRLSMHWQEGQHPSIGKEPGQVACRAPSRDTYSRGVTLIASGSMTEAPPANENARSYSSVPSIGNMCAPVENVLRSGGESRNRLAAGLYPLPAPSTIPPKKAYGSGCMTPSSISVANPKSLRRLPGVRSASRLTFPPRSM